jgi:hypothetical protein
MIALRLSRILNSKIISGFSNVKINPIGSKMMPQGFKPAPNTLNKPPLNQPPKINNQTNAKKK